MSRSPSVSVIIPTYKRPTFLGRALSSVERQSYSDWEIIVVDDNDASSEYRRDTERFMAQYSLDERIRYIKHKVNQGGGAARNTGIKEARGQYIAFLDDDDEWLPQKLEKQVKCLQENTACAVVYTGYILTFSDGTTPVTVLPELRGNILEALIRKNDVGTTSTILCKRDALLEIGMFDVALPSSQDYDLYLRLAHISEFDYIGEALVLFHRHSEGNISNDVTAKIEGFDQLVAKHCVLFESMPEAYAKHLGVFGRFFLSVGETAKAAEILRRALRLRPFDPGLHAYFMLAKLGPPAVTSVLRIRRAIQSW